MTPIFLMMIYVFLSHCWLYVQIEGASDNLNFESIDVVIPCTEKDLPTLSKCIQGICKYGKDIRRIIVISDKQLTDKAEWFDEKQFKFSKFDVANEIFQNTEQALRFIASKNSRIGWLYQQLLKLYAPITIPNISRNVLILDSDIIFLKPVSFFDTEGRALYNAWGHYYQPYFDHMKKLLPGLRRVYANYSGITHHMVFQRHFIEELCQKVEAIHKVELWKAMCRCINHNELQGSAFSEYEIYFNFILDHVNHEQVQLRLLKWSNDGHVDAIEFFRNEGYDYVSCHAKVW